MIWTLSVIANVPTYSQLYALRNSMTWHIHEKLGGLTDIGLAVAHVASPEIAVFGMCVRIYAVGNEVVTDEFE